MSENNNEKEAIILGALLHDIGKFYQRAFADENELSQQSQKMESYICPKDSETQRYTHRHVLWTNEFFEKYKRYFPINIFPIGTADNCANFASYHHNPSTHLQTIIQEADKLSAGTDRLEKDIADEIKGAERYKKVRLHSIFEKIDLKNNSFSPDKYRYELNSLELSKNKIFPKLKEELSPLEGELLVSNYNELWDAFIDEFKKLPKDNFNAFLNSLIFLLLKYTWCIPSSTIDFPDISLFDHLKTTAAIAGCLYAAYSKKLSIDDKFMLVCGDISGIQKFIYRISSKGAAKGLKGRSFYLQLLADAIAKHLLRQSGYYITNLLYSGGGRFYLLLDSGCEDKIQEEANRINIELLKMFNGEIYLALGISRFTQEDFDRQKFYKKWREASANANNKKRQKFLGTEYRDIFDPFGRGEKEETCQVCKAEPEEGKKLKKVPIGEEEINCCNQCEMLLDLGTKLSKHNLILEIYDEDERMKNTGRISFDFVKTSFYFVHEKEDLKKFKGREVILYAINSPENFLEIGKNYTNIGYGFKFIGGNFAPKKNEEILTFDELAKESTGLKRLGILRMDVDNLGQIFIKGLGENASISRLSTVSRNLDIFFNGYINIIAQKDEDGKKYKNRTYIIYSGGDDLFIVGAWDVIPKLAKDIYDEFRKFTCNKLTLSCGISLIPKKYPIYKGAELAKDEEEKAKEYKRNGNEKNAVSFLGTIVDWNDFGIAMNMTDYLVDWIKNDKLSESGEKKKLNKGIIDRLRRIYILYAENKKFWETKKKQFPVEKIKERIQYNQWLWRMVYTLDRYSKQNKLFEQEINTIKDALLKNEFNGKKSQREIIDYLNLPARWAEFLLREEERRNGIQTNC